MEKSKFIVFSDFKIGHVKMQIKKPIWSLTPVMVATAIFCCVLWGSASPAIKIAYELFGIPASDTASRLVLAGARFVLAGVMTILFGSLFSRKVLTPKIESLKYIGALALCQTIGQYFFFFTTSSPAHPSLNTDCPSHFLLLGGADPGRPYMPDSDGNIPAGRSLLKYQLNCYL